MRLATALEGFWVIVDPSEGARWFAEFLADGDDIPGQVRASAFRSYGGVVNPLGDDDLAESLYAQGLAEFRALGDEAGTAGLLVRLGHSVWYRGDNEAAFVMGREGLEVSRRLAAQRTLAQALGLVGELEFERGQHDLGLKTIRDSADTAAACGFVWWQARMHLRLAKRAREAGRDNDATTWALRGLELSTALDDRRRIIQLLDLLAMLTAGDGELERAGLLRGIVEAEVERAPLSAWAMSDLPPGTTDDPAFTTAVARGRGMPLDRAPSGRLPA